jgi:hypothetical protein
MARLLLTPALAVGCLSIAMSATSPPLDASASSPAWTGTRTFLAPGSFQGIRSLATDSSGAVYAAGEITATGVRTNSFVARLTPAGDLDPSFGTGGLTVFSNSSAQFPAPSDAGVAVVVVPSGVAVVSRNFAPGLSAIHVFDPLTGVENRTVPVPFEAMSAASDGVGGIVVAGVIRPQSLQIGQAARYDSSLTQVMSFGTNGVASSDSFFDAVDVVVDHLGRPVIASSIGVTRLTPSGALDRTFGPGGTVKFVEGRLTGITERRDGSLVGVGTRANEINLVAGWRADGSLDSRFGPAGFRLNGVGGGTVFSRVIPFGPAGFVVSTNVGLVRFDEYGAPTGARAAQLRSGQSDFLVVPLLRREDGQYIYGWWDQAIGLAQHQLHVTSEVIGPVSADGYWMVSAAGTIYSFGSAPVPALRPAVRVVNAAGTTVAKIATIPSSRGGWIVWGDGRVAAWGDAPDATPSPVSLVPGEKVTSVSTSVTGRGFVLFTDRGRVIVEGDAVPYGDATTLPLQGPVLDSVATPSGAGYYMVASDGGILSYGDAVFYGSMGGQPLNAPVRSLAPAPNGIGYWLVASDGGIFAFGPPFRGSMGDKPLNRPVVGMIAFGDGYLMVGSDGGIFNFSTSPFFGSLGGTPPPSPIVSVAAFLN